MSRPHASSAAGHVSQARLLGPGSVAAHQLALQAAAAAAAGDAGAQQEEQEPARLDWSCLWDARATMRSLQDTWQHSSSSNSLQRQAAQQWPGWARRPPQQRVRHKAALLNHIGAQAAPTAAGAALPGSGVQGQQQQQQQQREPPKQPEEAWHEDREEEEVEEGWQLPKKRRLQDVLTAAQPAGVQDLAEPDEWECTAGPSDGAPACGTVNPPGVTICSACGAPRWFGPGGQLQQQCLAVLRTADGDRTNRKQVLARLAAEAGSGPGRVASAADLKKAVNAAIRLTRAGTQQQQQQQSQPPLWQSAAAGTAAADTAGPSGATSSAHRQAADELSVLDAAGVHEGLHPVYAHLLGMLDVLQRQRPAQEQLAQQQVHQGEQPPQQVLQQPQVSPGPQAPAIERPFADRDSPVLAAHMAGLAGQLLKAAFKHQAADASARLLGSSPPDAMAEYTGRALMQQYIGSRFDLLAASALGAPAEAATGSRLRPVPTRGCLPATTRLRLMCPSLDVFYTAVDACAKDLIGQLPVVTHVVIHLRLDQDSGLFVQRGEQRRVVPPSKWLFWRLSRLSGRQRVRDERRCRRRPGQGRAYEYWEADWGVVEYIRQVLAERLEPSAAAVLASPTPALLTCWVSAPPLQLHTACAAATAAAAAAEAAAAEAAAAARELRSRTRQVAQHTDGPGAAGKRQRQGCSGSGGSAKSGSGTSSSTSSSSGSGGDGGGVVSGGDDPDMDPTYSPADSQEHMGLPAAAGSGEPSASSAGDQGFDFGGAGDQGLDFGGDGDQGLDFGGAGDQGLDFGGEISSHPSEGGGFLEDAGQGWERQGYWRQLQLTPVLPSAPAPGAGGAGAAAADEGRVGTTAASGRVVGSSVWAVVAARRVDPIPPGRADGGGSSRVGAAGHAEQQVQLPLSVQQVLQAATALGVAPAVLERASERLIKMQVMN